MMLTLKSDERFKATQSKSSVFSLRYAHDNSYIAAALGNGAVSFLDCKTGRIEFHDHPSTFQNPVTCIRFNPRNPKQCVSVTADGKIAEYLMKPMPQLGWSGVETNNEINTLEFDTQGLKFATAGLDKRIRLYDNNTKEIVRELFKCELSESSNGHINKVFALKFAKPYLLVSGGWDGTLQFWDMRQNESIRSIFGPYICGESLDAIGNRIVAGSYRTKGQISMYDLRTFTELYTVDWSKKEGDEYQALLYTTRFDPTGKFIIAGGVGSNKVRVFDSETGNKVGKSQPVESGIYTACFTQDGKNVLVGTNDGYVHRFGMFYQ